MVGSPSIVFSPRFISLTRPLKKHSDYHIIDRALDFLSSWNLFAPGANLSGWKMDIVPAWTAAACRRFPAASLLARIRPGNAGPSSGDRGSLVDWISRACGAAGAG
jgi:hypothetical protein